MEQTQPFDSIAEAGAAASAVTATGKAASGETEASETETIGGTGKAPSGWQAKRIGWFNVRGIFWISPIAAGVLWGLAVLAMTQVQVIVPQSAGFNWRVHDGLLLVILGLPLLALLGIVITAFHLAGKFRRVWLKIISVLAGVTLLVFLCLAAFAALIEYAFHAREPQAADICPTGHVCEYTSPWDPNDGFVRVYRESLLLRYYVDRLDPFGNLLTATNHELKVADYPPACTIENTDYAVVVIDKAGPANHNILARPQDGIWQQVADLPNGGYCVACRFDATSRTLVLTFQDTNGNHTVQTIPYPEQTP
ncbi:hypothetical protein [Mobiluncus mulieris]|uniref:hypothetical protein n=1 Tax=Mobiluncus mulieris TaxID=2052 RepID=UPI0014701C13|nr:hypothetical protein [Mobiluncus mulieris]MCV0008531.1 hypothetical protein [Mobiluncus mulieris]MCV0010614.1 hypothetical protein [Mobiluncus mulieris]NMX01373.1 hypothetical protein [Mobiluncus mulieris]NMX19230.1 hypothetical protein [Mobiluncus mulieris]